MKVRKKRSNAFVSAIAVLAAISFGLIVILLVVYVIIPSALQDANETIEGSFAAELYERTFIKPTPRPSSTDIVSNTAAEPVFEQPEPEVLLARDNFESVLQTNEDIIGRVNIAPDIKYLVTQSEDNKFYLKHGYEKQETKEGTVFLDYRCDTKTLDLKGHYILYGHHMKKGSMFAHLMEYKNELFFMENRLLRFDTLYEDYTWEIFSAYVTDTDFYFIETNFSNEQDWMSFITQIQQKSIFDAGVTLRPDDVILTLCTCTYEFDDARFAIHARLVK